MWEPARFEEERAGFFAAGPAAAMKICLAEKLPDKNRVLRKGIS